MCMCSVQLCTYVCIIGTYIFRYEMYSITAVHPDTDNGYADLNLPVETMTENHIQQQFCLYSEYTSVGVEVCMHASINYIIHMVCTTSIHIHTRTGNSIYTRRAVLKHIDISITKKKT